MKILIDSREQLPLWRLKKTKIEKIKLDVGDYTTKFLQGKAHAERKSPNDLYGSIIQNHERFRAMIERAREQDIKLKVFIECTAEDFLNKNFKRGKTLKCPGPTLIKIINTMSSKYCVEFIFCTDRADMKFQMLKWFVEEEKNYEETTW